MLNLFFIILYFRYYVYLPSIVKTLPFVFLYFFFLIKTLNKLVGAKEKKKIRVSVVVFFLSVSHDKIYCSVETSLL